MSGPVAMLMGAAVGPITLSAVWGNLTATGTPNANVTLTFAGPARTIRINHTGSGISDLEYRINSGTYTNCPDETTFSISSGDTLNFRANDLGPITEAVEVYDQTFPTVELDEFFVNIP